MLPQTTPVSGGSVSDLREFVNLRSEGDFKLLLAWIVDAYRCGTPKPVLQILGEEGGGKTTLIKILNRLIDPSETPVEGKPNNADDLMANAGGKWLLAFDNLSRIGRNLSDALCGLSTGSSLVKRKLYSDGERISMGARRPAILGGIADFAEANDLRDRLVPVESGGFGTVRRRSEAEFLAAFEAKRGRILGTLFGLLSKVLELAPEIEPEGTHRMVDYIKTGLALERILEWEPGSFMEAVGSKRTGRAFDSIEMDASLSAFAEFMEHRREWSGSVGELLDELEELVPDGRRNANSGWSGSPVGLSRKLREHARSLREVGYEIEYTNRAVRHPASGGTPKRMLRAVNRNFGAGGGGVVPMPVAEAV